MNRHILGFALAGLVILPGCFHVPTYKTKPLDVLNNHFVYRKIKNNIVFQTKCLTHGEIYYLFGDHTKELLKTTEIIYCSIHNLSNKDYVISLKNSCLSPLPMHEIRQLLKTSSAGRLATGTGFSGIASILFFSMKPWILGAIDLLLLGPSIACAIAALPFLGKGIKSMIMNSRISKDLNEKMLHNDTVIKSGDMLSGLIFVKASDYNPQFSVMMQEKSNRHNKIMFDVDVAINTEIVE